MLIFTTHPIQYQAPWFRALATEPGLEIEVAFSYVPDAAQQGVGFGTAFEWDIPLMTGYRHRVMTTLTTPSAVPAFGRRLATHVEAVIDEVRPDVAMILGWQEISLVQALLACRRRRIPVVLRGESNALRQRPTWVSAIHRRYFRMADAFLAIGSSNAEFYRQAGVAEDKILTARYFVDNGRFRDGAADARGRRGELRRRWAIPDAATTFAFVGKLEEKKCVLHFLESLELARNEGASVHGLVIGTGEQMAEATAFVESKELPVTFAGFLNQSQICEAYVAADALVLPSNYGETWGLVVNEAMATGLPAVVSDRVGSSNDLVVDGVTGLVFPFADRSALAEAMQRLDRDQGLRRTMGAAAEAHLNAGYSIELAVAQAREAAAIAIAGARRHAAH